MLKGVFSLRIVVLGDFQFDLSEAYLTESAMDDVAKVEPDLVVTLGDYGCNGLLGKPQGIEQAYSYLSVIGRTIRPILGNHDLQYETGDNIFQHGTMNNVLCNLFKVSDHHGVMEFDQFRLFFISTDPQPPESCYYSQECYLTDENFENILENLRKRPGVPALFFSHAPPIGSGLLTVPYVHVRATNAFLDQNHNPYRWFKLIQEFPEIVLWFSAHYHLGHMHPNSISERVGTVFFMNGVHSSVTRDGCRQSRVIDITPYSIQVKTLDHNHRALMDTIDWEHKGCLTGLFERKENIIKLKTSESIMSLYYHSPIRSPLASANSPIKIVGDFSTGGGAISARSVFEANNGHLFAATENGYLWEIDMQYGEALGTLHYHESPLKGIAITDNLVWRIWDNKIAVSDLNSPFRFVREINDNKHESVLSTLEIPAQCICGKSNVSALLGCNNRMYEALLSVQNIVIKEICSVNDNISQLAHCSNGTYIKTVQNEVYFYDYSGQCAYKGNSRYFYDSLTQNIELKPLSLDSLPRFISNVANCDEGDKNISLLSFHGDRMLLLVDGHLFFFSSSSGVWEEIPFQGFKVAAVCRVSKIYREDRICIALNRLWGDQTPRFQIWDIV